MKIQPSNSRGRATRLLLLPIAWSIAGCLVYGLLCLLAGYEKTSPMALLQTESMWTLAFFLPAILFGLVCGLIVMNLCALAISPLRTIFNAESKETGRHGFGKAMKGLLIMGLIYGLLSLGGSCLFLHFR